ncbi:hypothetical protein GQ53DRAFT_711540 [Thozetella sp. PMI_491]|nr:hypothetical protein GQ53DRAFT_711540 [Thozetella sp. PMI_491]
MLKLQSISRAVALALVLTTCTSATSSGHCKPTIPAPVKVLHTFPFPSWCENLAVRADGDILTTRLDAPYMFHVSTETGDAVEVTSWDASQWAGAMGIAENAPDVFYVNLAAIFNTTTFVRVSGVNSVFKIDMNTFLLDSDGVTVLQNATVSHLVDIPEADYLNGMVALNNNIMLTVDVYNGIVFALDVNTAQYRVAVDDPLMKYSYVSDPIANLGANGLNIVEDYLYWTNTAGGFVARARIDIKTGMQLSAGEIVAENVSRPDDFAIRSDGTMFVTRNQEDTLSVVYPHTTQGVPIAGSNTSTILAGVTAARFGRRESDKNILYLSTSGGLALPINGSVTVPGTISYIDAECF